MILKQTKVLNEHPDLLKWVSSVKSVTASVKLIGKLFSFNKL